MTDLPPVMAPLALLVLLALAQGETTGSRGASFREHRERQGVLRAERQERQGEERQRDDRNSEERQRGERQEEKRHIVRERNQTERVNRIDRAAVFTHLDTASANQSQEIFNSDSWSEGRRVRRAVLGEVGNSSLALPRQGRRSRERRSCTGRTGMSFTRYHPASTILAFLDCLGGQHKGRATLLNIGRSGEGRQLKVVRLSSGGGRPAIFIDGGIHAREWISPATAAYLAKQLVERKTSVLANFDVYILTLANPDGYEYSRTKDRLWRKNRSNPKLGRCAGVDLNRNFGYKWGGSGSSRRQCSEVFRGGRAFSEPESRAIRDFILARRRDIKLYLTLHSYGQMVLYPWGYDSSAVARDRRDLHSLGLVAARAMGRPYDVGSAATVNYEAAGASDDWAKGAAGIKYSYTIELPDALDGKHRFRLPASYILRTGREMARALKAMALELKRRL